LTLFDSNHNSDGKKLSPLLVDFSYRSMSIQGYNRSLQKEDRSYPKKRKKKKCLTTLL